MGYIFTGGGLICERGMIVHVPLVHEPPRPLQLSVPSKEKSNCMPSIFKFYYFFN